MICGRKKLPFAGYSIVKERLKLQSYQLTAASLVERRLRDELLSKTSLPFAFATVGRFGETAFAGR